MSADTGRPASAVTVTIARDPALVRTVRLVAASVARRAGRDEEFVEEVRLAAGEACALFLGEPADDPTAASPGRSAHAAGSDEGGGSDGDPVEVTITIADTLRVDVSTPALVDTEDHPDSDLDGIEPWALLRGLIEDFAVQQDESSTTVSMSWPLG